MQQYFVNHEWRVVVQMIKMDSKHIMGIKVKISTIELSCTNVSYYNTLTNNCFTPDTKCRKGANTTEPFDVQNSSHCIIFTNHNNSN